MIESVQYCLTVFQVIQCWKGRRSPQACARTTGKDRKAAAGQGVAEGDSHCCTLCAISFPGPESGSANFQVSLPAELIKTTGDSRMWVHKIMHGTQAMKKDTMKHTEKPQQSSLSEGHGKVASQNVTSSDRRTQPLQRDCWSIFCWGHNDLRPSRDSSMYNPVLELLVTNSTSRGQTSLPAMAFCCPGFVCPFLAKAPTGVRWVYTISHCSIGNFPVSLPVLSWKGIRHLNLLDKEINCILSLSLSLCCIRVCAHVHAEVAEKSPQHLTSCCSRIVEECL